MTRRPLSLAAASCFIVLAILGPASAAVLLFDTFDDQGANFPPVQWTPRSDRPGDYDGSSGSYVFTPTDDSTDNMQSNVLNVTFADVSIRSQVRVSGSGFGDAAFRVRGQNHVGDSVGYIAGVFFSSFTESNVVFITRQDAGADSTNLVANILSEIDVRAEDVMVQFDVFGNRLKLWAWRAGDPMPNQPQAEAIDSTYSDGIFGISSDGGEDGDSVTAFRFVQIEDESITVTIPEPSTLTLGALALVGLYFCRRRRRSPGC